MKQVRFLRDWDTHPKGQVVTLHSHIAELLIEKKIVEPIPTPKRTRKRKTT